MRALEKTKGDGDDPRKGDGDDPRDRRIRARIRAATAASGAMLRIVVRDPEHLAERLTLFAAERLSGPSLDWVARKRAEHPEASNAQLAERLRSQTAHIARIDGAVAGTPFLVALVPGYLGYLWQEARMTLRTAALYGRDPSDPRTSAEMLVLRGVHKTVDDAHAALIAVRDTPLPARPPTRRPLSLWVRAVYQLLVFGGFLSPMSGKLRDGWAGRLRILAGLLVGAAVWAITIFLPVSFMVVMAWTCESHARQLGRRALALYDGQAASAPAAVAIGDRRQDRGHRRRQITRTLLLALSVAIPLGFVAYTDHVRSTVGVNWLGALGALAAVSLVIATMVYGARR
jgi:hypothetical protein